jgi:peptide/nickel transport system ATP-binding protein
VIEVGNLSVAFGDTRVVNGVSFGVGPGEAFGLVGESGCGKTTILNCLAGRLQNWTGSITLAGTAVGPKRNKPECRLVQLVFQDPYSSLHPRRTVESTLAEPVVVQRLGNTDTRIRTAMDACGLPRTFRHRFPHELSGGQRQRVAIARALILESPVVLLDEPTSALDVSIQAEILNLLHDLRLERKLTYLLVSHDLAVVAHLCSRLAIMRAGELVEEVTREGLEQGILRHPYSRELRDASEGYSAPAVRSLASLETK